MKKKAFAFATVLALAALVSIAAMTAGGDKDGPASTAASPRNVNLLVDESPVGEGVEGRVTTFADVLDEVTPAVVSVYTSRIEEVSAGGRTNPLEELFRRRFGLPAPEDNGEPDGPTREQEIRLGMGSGLIVSEDGYILTNHHVVADISAGGPLGRMQRRRPPTEIADEITVKLTDGQEYEASFIGSDPLTDVAVLKIDAQELPALTLGNSDASRVGDIVFAVGNPLDVGLTVTQGIISGTGRTNLGILGMEGYENFLQTDASINRGNSGGPLVDAKGRVVGINTAIFSPTGGNIGIGFAIPVNLAADIMRSLVEEGEVRRGFLGVGIADISSDMALALGLDTTKGALVNEVQPGLPADEAGIRHGDVVVAVNGEPVESAADLRLLVSRQRPGQQVELTVLREGRERTFEVQLGDRDNALAGITERNGAEETESRALAGITLRPVNEELRETYEIAPDVTGLVVTGVAETSPHFDTLREGVVIVQVNRQPVSTLEDLENALRRDRPNSLYIHFEGRFFYTTLRLRD